VLPDPLRVPIQLRPRRQGLLLTLATACAGLAQAENGSVEQCLLRELATAPPSTTVAELRQRCVARPANGQANPALPAAPIGRALSQVADTAPRVLERLQAKDDQDRSLFERRVASESRAVQEPFALLPHRPNFLLPVVHQERQPPAFGDVGGAYRATEAQFQISFKFPVLPPLFGGRVLPFFAYTGRAWWQVYDASRSRPFREYNHEPEFLFAIPGAALELPAGWRHRVTVFGLNHQSNGRSVPQSRSWNRATAELWFDRGRHTWASLRMWQRFPEKDKADPSQSSGDDNPDITRFLGHFELRLGHARAGGDNLTAMLRHSLRTDGRGALQLDWSRPSGYSPSLRWTAHIFAGYGDSLVDYNVRTWRLGLGVMLNDWF
jgi:phospholipase A1/A2